MRTSDVKSPSASSQSKKLLGVIGCLGFSLVSVVDVLDDVDNLKSYVTTQLARPLAIAVEDDYGVRVVG